jgi:hypothetical protein
MRLTTAEYVEVFSEVAQQAVERQNVEHPEDVASAMSFAIEAAGKTLGVLWTRGQG